MTSDIKAGDVVAWALAPDRALVRAKIEGVSHALKEQGLTGKEGLKPAATGPLTVDVVGATTVWAHTSDGWHGRLTVRQLLQFWRRA